MMAMKTLKSLELPAAPFEVEVMPGIAFMVRPMTAFDLAVCRTSAQRILDDLAMGIASCTATGRISVEGYDPEDKDHVEAMQRDLLIKEIAVRHTTGWRGIRNEKGDADEPFDARHMRAILNDLVISEIFYRKTMDWHLQRFAAKKECAAAATGRHPAEPRTAQDAKPTDSPVPAGFADKTGSAAPIS